MKDTLQTGLEFADVVTVTDDMAPPHLPNKVLSTPTMVQLIEVTCLTGVQPYLDDNQTTVGIHVCVSHQAAAPSGQDVDVRATLSEIDRKRLVFDVQVLLGDTVVSEGTHQRFVVGS
ncbi:MAG: fluoroacetyl-CoA thioesterase [Candidatus Poriferisodalaceae bacterium]|jgi:fluoroacetyl-CoA thioesterase